LGAGACPLGVELAPLPLEEPNTSLPAGRCEVVGGTGVLAEPLGAVLLDAAGVDVELVTLEPDELECLAGFPSNRLPVPVKKLTFGSSTGGAPACDEGAATGAGGGGKRSGSL